MARLTKEQKSALINKINREYWAKREAKLEETKEHYELNDEEKVLVEQFNKIEDYNNKIYALKEEIRKTRLGMLMLSKNWGYFNGECTAKNVISNKPDEDFLPDAYNNFDIEEVREDLVLSDITGLDVQEYVDNIINKLDD